MRDEGRSHEAEARLHAEVRALADQGAQEAVVRATLRMLFESYVADLERQHKGPDTIIRAVSMAKAVEHLMPELLERPVSSLGDRDLSAFTQARTRTGAAPEVESGGLGSVSV